MVIAALLKGKSEESGEPKGSKDEGPEVLAAKGLREALAGKDDQAIVDAFKALSSACED